LQDIDTDSSWDIFYFDRNRADCDGEYDTQQATGLTNIGNEHKNKTFLTYPRLTLSNKLSIQDNGSVSILKNLPFLLH
jgi:hypothetical protein